MKLIDVKSVNNMGIPLSGMFILFSVLSCVSTDSKAGAGTDLPNTVMQSADWQAESEYTSLKETDCKIIEYIEESEGYYHASCASIPPYKLEVQGGDLRYGLNVIYENEDKVKKVRYWYPQFFNVGNTVEWRFHYSGGERVYHGLIYRMYSADFDEVLGDFRDKDKQELFVVRLDKENSCILGKVSAHVDMNLQARHLADDMTATCSDVLNEGGAVQIFLEE